MRRMLHFAISYEEARHFSPNGDAILKTSPRRGVLLRKKLFEFPENRMRGWVAADVADILQLFDLAHDLFEAGVFAHPEPDPAVLRRRQWQAENAVHIECAAGKEPMTWDIAPGWFARVSSRMVCTVLVFL